MNNHIDIERLRQLCAKNLDAIQIAARLGVTREAVREAAKRHGVTVAVAPRAQTDISFASPV